MQWKTYIGEVLVKWKALVRRESPDQTRYRSYNIKIANHELEPH